MKHLRYIIPLLVAIFIAAGARAQRIAVFSDVHVTPGNRCDSALRVAVSEVNAMGLDMVIVNGDLSNEGSDAELANVKTILDSIRHRMHVLPGNHENNWSQSAGKTFVDLWGADRFADVIGDSLILVGINCGPYMKMGDGHVKREDMAWLRHTLDSLLGPGRRVLSFNHYPIRRDDIDNYRSYEALLNSYPVVAHINGHYHHWERYDVGAIPAVMIRALDMRDGTYGYTILQIEGDQMAVYDKNIGQEPQLKYTVSLSDPTSHNATLCEVTEPDLAPFYADEASIFTRVTSDSRNIYFGNSLGVVNAVDRETGRKLWQYRTPNSLFSRPAVLSDTVVAVPTFDGIHFLDSRTGAELAPVAAADHAPYVADGVVCGDAYIQGGYKAILCFDAPTGELRWTYDSISNYCQGQPTVDGADVVFGAWDTNLRAVDVASGQLKWAWNNGRSANMLGPGNVVPVVTADRVVVVAPDRYITAIDRRSGQTLWRDNSHRYRESLGQSADGTLAYAKTMDGELVAVRTDTPDFSEAWIVDMGIGYDHAPCSILEHEGKIYVGSRRGIVTIIDAATHQISRQLTLGESEVNGFDVDRVDGSVYTSLIEGTIFKLNSYE